jgi:invasion protein IalB
VNKHCKTLTLGCLAGFLAGAAAAAPAEAPAPATPAEPVAKIVRTERLAFDNWTVTCAYSDQAAAKPVCSALTQVAEKSANGPRVIFNWWIGDQDSKRVSVLSSPTGVMIAPGVEMKIGTGAAKKYGYTQCAPQRCDTMIPMDAAIVAELKKAPTTEVNIVGIGGKNVKLTVTMKGIDQALAALAK